MEHICFIFPNRRSRAFFLKYLGEETASKGTVPILAPEALTINDFFYRATKSSQTDRTRLLVELYGQYKALNQKAESLDDFIFWGDILLGDFDDVDKYLADPAKIFTNIAEFKKMQDGMEYLTDTQREAIERLIGHFRNDKDTQRFRRQSSTVYGTFCFRSTGILAACLTKRNSRTRARYIENSQKGLIQNLLWIYSKKPFRKQLSSFSLASTHLTNVKKS